MENLKIKLSDLLEAGEVSGSVDNYVCPEIADSAAKQVISIRYTLRALEGNVLANGTISAVLTQTCSRCLNSFDFPIEIPICQVYPSTLEEIDLEGEIRELLILNAPTIPVCDENCKGLCPQCGKDLNKSICACVKEEGPKESRWESLRKLIKP